MYFCTVCIFFLSLSLSLILSEVYGGWLWALHPHTTRVKKSNTIPNSFSPFKYASKSYQFALYNSLKKNNYLFEIIYSILYDRQIVREKQWDIWFWLLVTSLTLFDNPITHLHLIIIQIFINTKFNPSWYMRIAKIPSITRNFFQQIEQNKSGSKIWQNSWWWFFHLILLSNNFFNESRNSDAKNTDRVSDPAFYMKETDSLRYKL